MRWSRDQVSLWVGRAVRAIRACRMLPLQLVAFPAMYVLSVIVLGRGVHCSLFHYRDCSDTPAMSDVLPMLLGIELVVVPLTALITIRWRIGTDRVEALCAGKVQLFLPLLMAATLVGLFCYLFWSWALPQASFGPNQFGLPRWLSLVLLAVFVWFWLPLFPRLTATLVGMISGPLLFAAIGYLLFPEFLTQGQLHDIPPNSDGGFNISVLLVPLAIVPFFGFVPLYILPGPKSHALWTAGVFFLTAYIGREVVRSWAL